MRQLWLLSFVLLVACSVNTKNVFALIAGQTIDRKSSDRADVHGD